MSGMHGLRHSILKRWHSLTITPGRAAATWSGFQARDRGAFREIACRDCRKFDAVRATCSVAFGTPLRKCVVAAIESHFHDVGEEEVLEIGFGRFTLARNLVRRGGGRWSGIDPGQPRARRSGLGLGGYGEAASIPFPDSTFDRVFGIQTLEHWGQRAVSGRRPSRYSDCMAELHRVLRPHGRLYLDAPIHFHGHEMFIMGDLERVRALFDPMYWEHLVEEHWREDHLPLRPYPAGERAQADWAEEVISYPREAVEELRGNSSVWLIAFEARKRA